MLEELSKALGPWPILQMMFGLLVLCIGGYAVVRGASGNKRGEGQSLEDMRADWAARKQLENIEQNSFRQVVLLEKTIEAINHLTDNIWNRKQF